LKHALVLEHRAWDSGLWFRGDLARSELAKQNKATSAEIDRLQQFGRLPDGRPSPGW